jgi:hypothetical protein
MNIRNLLIASLAGGLISLVLVNVPVVNFINLLICAGFWIGPIAAVWLYRRLGGTLTLGQAVLTGLLAGAWHGLLGLLLSPLGLAGVGGLLSSVRLFLPDDATGDLGSGLNLAGAILFNLAGAAVDIVFGLIGGLIGGVLFGARPVTRS